MQFNSCWKKKKTVEDHFQPLSTILVSDVLGDPMDYCLSVSRSVPQNIQLAKYQLHSTLFAEMSQKPWNAAWQVGMQGWHGSILSGSRSSLSSLNNIMIECPGSQYVLISVSSGLSKIVMSNENTLARRCHTQRCQIFIFPTPITTALSMSCNKVIGSLNPCDVIHFSMAMGCYSWYSKGLIFISFLQNGSIHWSLYRDQHNMYCQIM